MMPLPPESVFTKWPLPLPRPRPELVWGAAGGGLGRFTLLVRTRHQYRWVGR